ncbi:MAG: alpha/beta hydrolase [Rhodospirillaceae bacterium]|nr:alpha/beta hydrolase [Rhodospirillaceae bacterium]
MNQDLDVKHNFADLGDVLIHYVMAGAGPAIVLLHGWPQTWWEWRHIIPSLAMNYTVIAPDLRGLGDSSRPLNGYDKKTVANDIWRLVNEILGYKSFFLVGHDWGGPTAYALAAAHPEAVEKMVILDVTIPGCGGDFSEGSRRWHHQFHSTPDLAEALTQGREGIYLSWFYRTFAYKPDSITNEDLKEYLRTYVQPGAMRAGFSYYRAIPQDIEDNKKNIQKMKLPMPVLAIGGGVSYPNGRGRGKQTSESLARVADNVTGEVFDYCGHFIPEEAPSRLNDSLARFFAE